MTNKIQSKIKFSNVLLIFRCVDYVKEKGQIDKCVFAKHKPTKIVPSL